MSTRSVVGIKIKDGYSVVYCHWDGYPEYNGKLLCQNYNTREKVLELLKMGNISSLDKNIGEKHNFEPSMEEYTKRQERGWSTFYKRDRNEADQDACFMESLKKIYEEYSWSEYMYIFEENDKWTCRDMYTKRKRSLKKWQKE